MGALPQYVNLGRLTVELGSHAPERLWSGLDGSLWMRTEVRRLRMCYWKQWRRPSRRIRELIKLGVNTREAICLGLSRKSYWRLSKTMGTNSGLSNAHFKEIGLLSVRELWCKIHYPATARQTLEMEAICPRKSLYE